MRGEQVVVLTGVLSTNPDPYSTELFVDWSKPPVETLVDNVLCEPRPSGEPLADARNSVTSGWTLYLQDGMPVGTTLTPINRIKVRDVTYDVLGEPSDWRLGSWRPGLVVQTSRTAG